ncbi:MAG TPA: RluA family pseudouridine synthase [Candidatus Paceibacterota bacterium]
MSNLFDQIGLLYEDADCVVLSKPAGLMVHPDGRTEGPCLTDWLVGKYPALKGVGETQKTPEGVVLDRPGIVHRLDRDTSGAILVAKTPEAHAFFKEQFQERSVAKKYLAFVWGEMKESFGTITRPIGRSFKGGPKWSAQRGARGEMRDAETYWTRLWTGTAVVDSEKGQNDEKFSLVQAEPKTGRTHQIRVHLQAVHHPVVADSMYAPKKPVALGFERLALHSWQIEFETTDGKRMKILAPLPADFQNAMAALKIKNLPK